MSNKTPRLDDTVYEITFTLSQDGMTGDIYPSVNVNPEVEDGVIPAAYSEMAYVIDQFMQRNGIVDENGNFLDAKENNYVLLEDLNKLN